MFHEIRKIMKVFQNIEVKVRGRTVRPKVCGTLRGRIFYG